MRYALSECGSQHRQNMMMSKCGGSMLITKAARATVLLVTADKANGAGSRGESCEATVVRAR